MTDKEAIEVLKDLWRYEHSEYPEKQIREALEKGIKALEEISEISEALVYICDEESHFYGFESEYHKAEKWSKENKQ